jgi:hypothetical protein
MIMRRNKINTVLFIFVLLSVYAAQCSTKDACNTNAQNIPNNLDSNGICFMFINPKDSTYMVKGKMGIYYQGVEEGINHVWLDETRTFVLDSSGKIVVNKSYLRNKFHVSNNDSLFAAFGYYDENNTYDIGFHFCISQCFVKKEVRVFPFLPR